MSKLAPTETAAVTVTTQLPVPLHGPLQPVKVESTFAIALSVTTVLPAYVALHVEPQDTAEAALFLASPEARFITGVNLTVNAGNLM